MRLSKGYHNGYSEALARSTICQVAPAPSYSLDAVARFWANVRKETDGCWEWTANRTGGGRQRLYGQFTYQANWRQVHVYAHRFAWELTHGPIPARHYICHSCDNGGCVRPDHLFLGTQFDNMRDASRKGRLNVPRLRTRSFKAEAVARYLAGGVTAAALAVEYRVSMATVLRWVRQDLPAGIDLRHTRSGNRRKAAA